MASFILDITADVGMTWASLTKHFVHFSRHIAHCIVHIFIGIDTVTLSEKSLDSQASCVQ